MEGNSSRRSTNEIDTNNMATTEKENNRIFQPKCLINGFVTILTRWVPLVEQELLILPEHLSSPPVFSRVHVTRSLVLCVWFVDHCLSFCPFYFCLCVFCPSICKFWLHLWYLQTLLAYHWTTPVTKPNLFFKTWLPLLHGPFISISLCTYMMLYSFWLVFLLWRSIQSQTLLQFVSGSLIDGDTENKTSEHCQCLMFAIPLLVHIQQVRCSLNCIYT